MGDSDSRIRWKRVVRLAALLTLCAAMTFFGVLMFTGARWDHWAQAEQFRSDSEKAARDSRFELDNMIALVNHEGYPTSSLYEQCIPRSTDTIQVIVMPGMSLTYGMRIAELRRNRLTYADQHFDRSRASATAHPGFVSISSLVAPDTLQKIWSNADGLIATTSPGSTYSPDVTDASEDVIEICRDGRYSYFARYMGTEDPSNDAIFRFEELLLSQASK